MLKKSEEEKKMEENSKKSNKIPNGGKTKKLISICSVTEFNLIISTNQYGETDNQLKSLEYLIKIARIWKMPVLLNH